MTVTIGDILTVHDTIVLFSLLGRIPSFDTRSIPSDATHTFEFYTFTNKIIAAHNNLEKQLLIVICRDRWG